MKGGSGGFGSLLRELRSLRGLTIEELAEASGISGRAIGDMERGRTLRPQRGTVTALAQGLALDEQARAELLALARSDRAGARAPTAGTAAPQALPRGVRDFVGREREVASLRRLAAPVLSGVGAEGAPPAAVVSGAPGSGKTTMAVRVAEDLSRNLSDGAFLVDMRGLDLRPVTASEAASRMLRAWGVDDLELARLTAEQRLARYQDLAAATQAVLVLDNVSAEEQVRALLPREGRLLVLVTSRNTLADLEGVNRVELAVLAPGDSVALLRGVVGAARVDAEPQAADEVAELCGHLPLALRIAANWAATRTNWSLQRLVARLIDEDRRLDSLSAGDLRVSAAFALSYSRLAPATARMFRLLSLVPGQEFGLPLAAVLADSSLPVAEDLLEELLEAGLLMTVREDRYRFHDLLRLYARAQHRSQETAGQSAAARAVLRSWLLETVAAAGCRHRNSDASAAPGPTLVPLEDRGQAMGWLRAESENWWAAFQEAAAEGEHSLISQAADELPADEWISWGHWVELYGAAARAASAVGDKREEARRKKFPRLGLLDVRIPPHRSTGRCRVRSCSGARVRRPDRAGTRTHQVQRAP
ncbi:helix-turn-helix domain-containing protein [Streptomyces sp. NPDC006207]